MLQLEFNSGQVVRKAFPYPATGGKQQPKALAALGRLADCWPARKPADEYRCTAQLSGAQWPAAKWHVSKLSTRLHHLSQRFLYA